MELLESPAVGGLLDLDQHLSRPGFVTAGESMSGFENFGRDEDHPGVLDGLAPICFAIGTLQAFDRVEIFVSGFVLAPKKSDKNLRRGALLEPVQAGSGVGAGGQPLGDRAACVSTIVEDLANALGQHTSFATTARVEPVL
jgi:hypothetical protein